MGELLRGEEEAKRCPLKSIKRIWIPLVRYSVENFCKFMKKIQLSGPDPELIRTVFREINRAAWVATGCILLLNKA